MSHVYVTGRLHSVGVDDKDRAIWNSQSQLHIPCRVNELFINLVYQVI